MRSLSLDLQRMVRLLLWSARITGTFYAACVLLFVGAYILHPDGDPPGLSPTASEAFALALDPAGVCAGPLAALRRPLVGGCVSLVSLAGFCGWLTIARGDRGLPGLILIAGTPAGLYVAQAALSSMERRRRAAAPAGR